MRKVPWFDSSDNLEYFIKFAHTKTTLEWAALAGCSRCAIQSKAKRYNVKTLLPPPIKHTVESKRLLSEKRKQWLADNPDKHPWKRSSKFKSTPCEKVKEFLTKLGISFVPEFDPQILGRFFSIDIALPDKMIALEINGNQHYERNGQLKPYYQTRHDCLESNGWKVFEIHYSACFNLDKWTCFVNDLQLAESVNDFDYFTYVPKKTKDKITSSNQPTSRTVPPKRSRNKDLGIDRPERKPKTLVKKIRHATKYDPEILKKQVWEVPTLQLAKIYGVSDKAIEKWCKKHGIEKPPRGYWAKKRKK